MNIFRILLILLLLPGTCLLAEMRLELSRNTISLDDSAELILVFDSAPPSSIPSVPLPDGLKIIGTSRQDIVINRRRESQVRYTLKAEKTGTFPIGPFEIQGKAGAGKLNQVVLTVNEPKTIESTEELFVTLESNSKDLLVRETAELTLSLYTRVNLGDLTILDFPEEGIEMTPWQRIQARDQVIGERRYRVLRYVAQMTPKEAGTLTLNPNFRVEVIETDDAFGMMFSSRSRRSMRLKLKHPLVIDVNHPPEEGRPETYNGHLGNFQLKASVSPREVNVGDPITLRVELSGSGSLQQALPPGIKESDDFKVYKPKLITEELQQDGLSGRKIIEQVLIPKHAEVTEIPAITFSYYDTANRNYKTLQTGPFALNVLESGSSDVPALVSSLSERSAATEPTLLGNDLVYLKTSPGDIRTLRALEPGWTFSGIATLPFALWALVGIVVRKQEQKELNLAGNRRHQAPRKLQKHLKELEKEGPDPHVQIWKVLTEYIAARLNLPPGELNPQDTLGHLELKVQPETLGEVKQWMDLCERARFAGTLASDHSASLREDFRSFMLKLDREMGK